MRRRLEGRATPVPAPRFAALDIGTNSVRLLGAEGRPGRIPRVLVDTGEVTQLGAALVADGRIAERDLARTESAAVRCLSMARHAGISRFDLVGTEVLRAAANGAAVAAALGETIGLPLRILSEREEAEASFLGAVGWSEEPYRGECVVLDVGGGSTELTGGSGGRPGWSQSEAIGALRVTSRFLLHDPPLAGELTAARHATLAAADRLAASAPRDVFGASTRVIAVGGTACAIGAWVHRVVPYEAACVDQRDVGVAELRATLAAWCLMGLEERMREGGLGEGRARLVLGGGLILEALALRLAWSRFEISTRGLRHGLVLQGFGGGSSSTAPL